MGIDDGFDLPKNLGHRHKDMYGRDMESLCMGFLVQFAALMILGGFSPNHIGNPGIENSVCYPGSTYPAEYDALSQLARFDPHAGRQNVPPKNGRHVHNVLVQGALHLALGILKMCPKRTRRQWIIFPNPALTTGEGSSIVLASLGSRQSQIFDYWTTLPRTLQLNRISYNLDQLVHISIGAILIILLKAKWTMMQKVTLWSIWSAALDYCFPTKL